MYLFQSYVNQDQFAQMAEKFTMWYHWKSDGPVIKEWYANLCQNVRSGLAAEQLWSRP